MKIDLYTKACLTVIAFSLLTLSIQPLIPVANATTAFEQAVREASGVDYKGEGVWVNNPVLSVYCKNCN